MAHTAQSWGGEHLFLLLKKASPEKKERILEDFNKSLGFNSEQIREWKHVSGLSYPRCGSGGEGVIVCYGHMQSGGERQRYLCRSCGSTFNDHTNTLFHRTKKLEKWPAFLKCILEGMTIRESAREVGISPTTAQAWRKKIMSHLMEHVYSALTGIVEYAEVKVNPSNKGQKKAGPDVVTHKNTVVFCKSRKGEVFIGDKAEWDRLPKDGLTVIGNPATSCSVGFRAERILFHSRNVAPIRDQFAKHYARMRGVAGRYLRQYAVLYQFLIQTEGVTTKERLIRLLRLLV